MSLHLDLPSSLDKNNQGAQPAALTGTSLSSLPSPVMDSMNQGGDNFASNTGLSELPASGIKGDNQGAEPAKKSGPGGQ